MCNLDGDNIISPEFVPKCVGHFAAGCKLVWFHDGTAKAGTCGRIAYLRDDFWAVRGYDQDLLPMGYQDIDIVERLKKHLRGQYAQWSLGPQQSYEHLRVFAQDYSERLAVRNTVPAKIANIDPAIKAAYQMG